MAAADTVPIPPMPKDATPISIRLTPQLRSDLDDLIRAAKQPLGVVTRASYIRYLIERAVKEAKRAR
jgi:hypothetical protein